MAEESSVRSVYFHEDDFCQVEILPSSAVAQCLAEMNRVDEFKEAHRDGSAGFTDIYVRDEPPIGLVKSGITLWEMRVNLVGLLPPFDQVFTGYSSYRELCPSTVAWGEDDGRAVFAAVGEGELIRAVWLSVYDISPDRIEDWVRVLQSLPRAFELVIADWNCSEIIPIADTQRLTAYLTL